MRLAQPHLRSAMLAGLVLACSACQSAQKPVSLLPPGSAPSLSAVAAAPAPAKPAGSTAGQAQPSKPDSSQKAASAGAAPAQTSIQDSPQASSQASSRANPTPATSDPVGDLVARVEKEYQAGVVNYKAGNTDAAKLNFDNAFNAM